MPAPATARYRGPPRRRLHRHCPTAALPAAALPAATCWIFAGSTVYALALALLMALAPRWPLTRRALASPAALLPLALAYGVLLAWSWTPDTLRTVLPGSLAEGLSGGFNPQFFPRLAGVAALFARPATAASLWAHLLAVNLFAARAIFMDGERERGRSSNSTLGAVDGAAAPRCLSWACVCAPGAAGCCRGVFAWLMIGAGLDQGVATWHSVILCMVLAPLGILSHALSKVSADADAPGARPAAPAGACSTCPHACALLPCRRRCGGPPARELACDADGTAAWAEKKNKNKKKTSIAATKFWCLSTSCQRSTGLPPASWRARAAAVHNHPRLSL
jgi:hypothetical protein